MAKQYGTNTTPRGQIPVGQVDGSSQGGHVRVYREQIVLAAGVGTTADTIVVAYPSKGEQFLFGVLNATVSLGTSTVAIGIAGATGKYRAAAAFTATDTPTLFGAGAAGQGGLGKLGGDDLFLARHPKNDDVDRRREPAASRLLRRADSRAHDVTGLVATRFRRFMPSMRYT